MNSTTRVIPSNAPLVLIQSGMVYRWGGLPLMAWMLIQGLPLGRTLEPVKPALMEDVYARTLQATSAAASLNSMLLVAVLAGLYGAAAGMLLSRPRAAASVLSRQWPLLVLLLLIALSLLWSHSQDKVIMNIVHNSGAILVALAAALRYRNDPWLLPRHLGYALGLNIVVQLGAVGLLPGFAIDWEGRWLGLTGQANTLGALGFCAFWANGAALCAGTPDRYRANVLLAALAALAMLGANSVTSMIAAACMTLAMVLLSHPDLQGRIGSKTYFSVLLGVPLLAILVLLLVNAFDLGAILGLAGRSGDFSGRTSIWLDALALISMRPLLGWSFDDHAYVIRATGMLHTSYHNGYLDLAVTGGAVALALLLSILLIWALECRRPSRVAHQILPIAIPFVLSLLVYNVTEASFVAPRNLLWMVFLTLVLLGSCRRITMPKERFLL